MKYNWTWIRGNKRGFIDPLTLTLVAVCGVVLWFTGPMVFKGAKDLIYNSGSNQQKSTHKSVEQYPVFYKDEKGNLIPAKVPYMKTEEGLEYTNAEPPETLWQKFTRLGVMAVVIIVVLSYLGILPVIRLWWDKKVKPKLLQAQQNLEALQEEKDQLSADAKLIVRSVDEGLAVLNSAIASAQMQVSNLATLPDSPVKTAQLGTAQAVLVTLTNLKSDFMIAMSRKQNDTTKLLVAELKND